MKISRSYYLNEDFPYLNILEGTIRNNEIEINVNGTIKILNFTETFIMMGLTFNATVSLRTSIG